jgi:hypothetical protein
LKGDQLVDQLANGVFIHAASASALFGDSVQTFETRPSSVGGAGAAEAVAFAGRVARDFLGFAKAVTCPSGHASSLLWPA